MYRPSIECIIEKVNFYCFVPHSNIYLFFLEWQCLLCIQLTTRGNIKAKPIRVDALVSLGLKIGLYLRCVTRGLCPATQSVFLSSVSCNQKRLPCITKSAVFFFFFFKTKKIGYDLSTLSYYLVA